MRKLNWSEKVQGHVVATISGRLVEPFINRCMRENIRIWDIQRVGEDRIQCSILLSDVKRLKQVLKKTDCRIHFEERVGFPFWTRRLLSRSGMLAGVLLFLVIIFILSNMVWRIQIKGADPILENEIRTLLAKRDIHVGSMTFLLPSLGAIEEDLSSQLKETTWVGVSRDGTTYRIDVVQKVLPKKEKAVGPQDLVANKTGTITKLYVENGQSVVQPNEVVKKGQRLVSGMLGDERDPKFVTAKGYVLAETWYTSDTQVPLNTTFATYTGKTYIRRQIKLGNWHLPVWGFNSHPFKKQDKEVVTYPFHFLRWDLPISFQTITYKEADQMHHGLSKEEAVELGRTMARKELMRHLDADAKILSEKVQRETEEKGVVKLHIFFTVEENIAKPRPFAASDRKQELEKKMEDEKAKEQGN